MTLNLKNYLLSGENSLTLFLSKLPLHGKESRERSRFVKILAERFTEIEGERLKMIKEAAEKKDGKEVLLDKEGKETLDPSIGMKYKVSDESLKKFSKEYQEYLNEELIIEVTTANSEMVNTVKDIVLKTQQTFTGPDAVFYDEWCTAFENIKK